MKLTDLKKNGHAPTLLSAFLHFDVSFMIWVILGALAPFLGADASLTGQNLQVAPIQTGPYTLVIKAADSAKGQPVNVYNLLVKPGEPSTATRASVKPVESFVLDNADPASIAKLNATSHLIRIKVAPDAHGNPNENVLALASPTALAASGKPFQPVANGYPASAKLTLVGIPLLAAAFWRILLGVLADHFGAKRVGVASLLVTLVPLALGWLSGTSYNSLLLVGFFLGIAGASFAVALPLASRWYPPELQGIALGIAGAGNSGTVMATIFAPVLAKLYGWHAVFGLLMIPVTITLAVFAFMAKDPPQSGKKLPGVDFVALLRTKDTWTFCFLYFVTFGGFVGLSSFFNTFFVDQYDAPKAAVGLWTWPFIVAGSLLRPVGGVLADKIGGIRMLSMVYGAAMGCALAVGLFIKTFLVAEIALLFLMSALGMGNGSVFQLVPQRFKAEIGVMTGLVGAAGGIGGYYLNFALGHVHDLTGSYAWGFVTFGCVAGFALVTLRVVGRGWVGSWLGIGGQAQSHSRATRETDAIPEAA